MPYVNDAMIGRIEYEPATEKLYVTFISSGTQAYKGVPEDVYEAFLDAPRKDDFFDEKIKDRYS